MSLGFPGGTVVKKKKIHLPVQETPETWIQSLGQEDPLEKEWQPTPVSLPGNSHGQRSLLGSVGSQTVGLD